MSTPSAVKSLYLKFVELLSDIDRGDRGEVVRERRGSFTLSKITRMLGFKNKTVKETRAEERAKSNSNLEKCVEHVSYVVCSYAKKFQDSTFFHTHIICWLFHTQKYFTLKAGHNHTRNKQVPVLDEVDLILHPLKSELNWPLGQKLPLDFTRSRAGFGLRWQIPFHILDVCLWVVRIVCL